MDRDWDNMFRRMDEWSQEMDQFMKHVLSARKQQLPFGPATWHPAVNVYETQDALVLYAELAGVNPDDVAVRYEPDRLIVVGQRRDPLPDGCCTVLQMEVSTGPFAFEVALPAGVQPDNIEATYHDGWLEIRLPKTPQDETVVRTLHPRSTQLENSGQ